METVQDQGAVHNEGVKKEGRGVEKHQRNMTPARLPPQRVHILSHTPDVSLEPGHNSGQSARVRPHPCGLPHQLGQIAADGPRIRGYGAAHRGCVRG